MKNIKFSSELTNTVQPYYLGLDIGTNSVGWAITNKEYRIIKKAGKALWGSRLFKEAQPASARRLFRSARRRRKRTQTRIKLLQEYFASSINILDPGFYQRLKDSFFINDDKQFIQSNTLFNDENFKDKDYHFQFPTIYHLRSHLMETSEPQDPRLVYLACHHIMKNRGNFLIEGNLVADKQLDTALQALQNYWLEESDSFLWAEDRVIEVSRILLSKRQNSSDKARALQNLLVESNSNTKEICKLVAGNSAKLSAIFDDSELNESEVKAVKFADGSFDNDETRNALQVALGDHMHLLDLAYSLFSAALLQKLLQGNDGKSVSSISEARINIYKKHEDDLEQLKAVVRTLSKLKVEYDGLYSKIFRQNKKGLNNYVAYSGHVDSKDSASPITRCKQEDFYKFLKKELEPFKEFENVTEIWDEIDQEIFLPKISSSANGIIPHQLHGIELEEILHKSQTHLKFLTEDVISEILQIFNFRIPYYIGPFDDRSKFSWLKRKSNEPVRPWNLYDVVDVETTAELFIRNLTNKCTYLIGEDVLPKESILYSEYMVRNAINTLTVNGDRLDKVIRERLYENLFVSREKGGRITKKRVVSSLIAQGLQVTENSLGGMDLEIPAKLKAQKDFAGILNGELTNQEIETIIEKITAFPDSPEMVRNYVSAQFSNRLVQEQVERIARLSYKDWGRLSRKFLTGIKHESTDGRRRSIIEIMRDEAVNLMEILDESRFTFSAQVKSHNEGLVEEPNSVSEEYLEALRLSPPVKKAVRQVLLISKELFSIMEGAPERIFIEMARQEEDKKRTTSRKQQLASLYANCKEDAAVWSQELQEMPEDRFKSKKLYLYCMQRGRCMYSGESIQLEDLFNSSNLYDIDHIYPRSLTKDDSWNNLVLVKQELNRGKSDAFPLSDNVQKTNAKFWQGLLQCGFLNEEKFKRLTRKGALTADELTSFINRQLVETRQSTKSLAEIFQRVLPSSEVVYVKAGLVSDFRYNDGTRNDAQTEFYFPKVRSLNDFHHAKDAYLNIVVGNAYHVKFTKNFFLNMQHGQYPRYNLVKYFDREIKEKDHVVWIPGEGGTIKIVKQMMNRNNILLSYEASRNTGSFFDQMLMKKGKGQHPIKSSVRVLKNLNRYGGFNKIAGSHFCVIRHQKNKKFEVAFLALPIFLRSQNFSTESVIAYLEGQGFENITILCSEIKYGSEIEYNGVRYRVKAKTGNRIKCAPAIQAAYSSDDEILVKEIERAEKLNEHTEIGATEIINSFFMQLTNRLKSNPFNLYEPLRGQGTKLSEFSDRFFAMTSAEKCRHLLLITRLINGSGETVDFSQIYTDKNATITGTQSGSLFITINDKNDSTLSIFNSSITGFFKNKRKVF